MAVSRKNKEFNWKNCTNKEFANYIIDSIPSSRPHLLVSEHALQNRVYPQASPKPGPLSFEGAEFTIEIIDNFVPWSPVKRVSLMKSVQSVGTSASEFIQSYYIEHYARQQAYYTASKDGAGAFVTQRFEPMIDSYGIRHLFRNLYGPDNKNIKADKAKVKNYSGCQMTFDTLRSLTGMSSSSIPVLHRDEIDQTPPELASGHGNILELSEARTSAFEDDKKIFDFSTPGLLALSLIYVAYMEGDQRKFFVMCPKCGHFQILESKNLWCKNSKTMLDVSYICQGEKECELKNHHKYKMFKPGYWEPTAKVIKDPLHRSYHLNALYSPPWAISFSNFYKKMMKAKEAEESGRDDISKTFTNLYEGLPYEPKGKRPKWQKNNPLRQSYPSGTIHKDVLFFTAMADVQRGYKDPAKKQPARIEVNIFGHGTMHRMFFIEHVVLEGEITTAYGSAFTKLDEFLEDKIDNPYTREDGRQFPIVLTLIDSGDGDKEKGSMQAVYDFCEPRVNCFPTKGFATVGKDYDPNIDKKKVQNPGRYKRKKISQGLTLIEIVTNYYKERLYSYIDQSQKNIYAPDFDKKGGYLGFPKDFSDKMFDQLNAAEYLEDGTYDTKGRIHEQLDLYVGGLCGGDIFIEERTNKRREDLLKAGANPEKIEKFTEYLALKEIQFAYYELNTGTKEQSDAVLSQIEELFTR
jgi:phage terminase large subunit GpA-like protein